MKKMINIRRIASCFGCVCLVLIGYAAHGSAQGLLSREIRPGWSEPYENFSTYDMRKYPSGLGGSSTNPMQNGPVDRVSFDQFGNFILPGNDTYNLTWDMSDVGAEDSFSGNYRTFNSLMISSDEIGDWQTKFIIGDNLRTYFTPSTFKKQSFSGIRWDASNRRNSFSLIASAGNNDQNDRNNSGNFKNIFGGHWQSVLGDVMTIGGTFVMENRGTSTYSNYDVSGGADGLLNRDVERYFYVVITSDSPEDKSISARVYDVQPVIDGKKLDLPMRVNKIPDAINMHEFSQGEYTTDFTFENGNYNKIPQRVESYMYDNGSWFLSLMNGGDRSDHFDQFFKKATTVTLGYVNLLNPDNPDDATDRMFAADNSSGYYEARGTDVIIYEVLVPARARKVEFLCNVSNDYCIDIIAALPDLTQQKTGGGFYDDPSGGNWESGSWSPIYSTKHCAKAPGRVTDNSNAGWVKAVYDRVTGINVYGLNMELNWRGLYVRGEINEYNVLRAYPVHESFSKEDKNIESARAWFINIEKDFGTWSVGGELFDYPNDYMREWGGDFIDDNDDNNNTTGGTEYPGLDYDHDASDQRVDTTFAGEPYIGYYFDEVSFGDDFNHNGIIDQRENDDLIDMPYERDSSGQHFFVKIKPSPFTFMTMGHYDIEQDELGGRNLTNYVKFEHMQRIGDLEYGLFHRTERVQDNYKSDAYYRQDFGGPFLIGYRQWDDGDSYYGWSGTFNNFLYRDSWAHSSFVKTKLVLFDKLNIINNVKHDLISRKGDLSLDGSEEMQTKQLPRDIATTAFVHKIDYEFRIADFKLLPDIYWRGIRILKEKRIRQFSIIPQFKLVNFYLTENYHMRDGDNHIYNYYPVLRFDYQVAPRTQLRCAFQGLPGLEEVYRNRERPMEEENRRRMFIGFETRTIYQGFNMLVTSGIRRDKRSFVEPMGRRLVGSTEYFVTLRFESGR